MHRPDQCRHGSPDILRFIRETQPLLGCSGHIHESPYQRGRTWSARMGRTFWFQPGQEGANLHYIVLEAAEDLEIHDATHSVLGLLPE